MSWRSDKAIERLVRTFQRVKSQIFEEDIKAIKTINETIIESEKSIAVDNLLFAKLLCYILNQNLHHHGNMKQSIEEVSGVFKKPLNHHVSILATNLNNQALNIYLKEIGIDFNSLSDQPDLIKSNQKQIIEKIKNNWDKSKVEKSFINTINEFLRDTDNYV